jgi:hypothetical protein
MSDAMRILFEDEGFGLNDLSHAVGYPVAALRAHRSGKLAEQDPTTAADVEDALGELVRVCERLKTAGSDDPATLLNCRVVEGYTATGWTLRQAGYEVALFDLAAGRDPEMVLNHYIPDWRQRYWTDYEVFPASDGHLSIRKKEGSA